jgi:hypothetical protein
VTIRGRHPRYSGPEFEALQRSMAHYPAYGPPDPKWNKVKPNFEGVPGTRDEPHDAYKDRRLTGEIP